MVLVKNVKFLLGLYLGKTGLEIVFGDVLDRKQAFLDYKNVDFTWSSHWIFPEGLIHDFSQKFEFFVVVSLWAK